MLESNCEFLFWGEKTIAFYLHYTFIISLGEQHEQHIILRQLLCMNYGRHLAKKETSKHAFLSHHT
jgi:hypothetical protein